MAGTYVLANGDASFTLQTDLVGGIYLASFQRKNDGHPWVNTDTSLWRAKVFDTTGSVSTVLSTINPSYLKLAVSGVNASATRQTLTCTWTGIVMPAGADTLDVTVRLELRNGEDWLRCTFSAAWHGTATRWALDSLGVLPLSMGPYQQGNDYAIVPCVAGILSRDPCTHLSDASRVYPSGRGFNMAVWGYYETVTNHGWMIWAEDWSLETFYVRWESSASRLLWQMFQLQEDNIQVNNNGRTLGSSYTFCLRPMRVTQQHGWWDIGRHYYDRMEAGRPSFYTPRRIDRTDLSDYEKAHPIFVDVSATDTTHGAGEPGLTEAVIANIRTNSGAPSTTPIIGTVEASVYSLERVNEAAIGDLRTQLSALYTNQNSFLSVWVPETIGPGIWSHYRWFTRTAQGVDSNELRWWTNNDLIGLLRMSRQGYLNGGGNDNLLEEVGAFYRERNYTVVSWDGGTKTATVTGSPSGDGFTGALIAILIPASSAARLARADVSSLGASTITVSANFLDGTGATATPAASDTIEVVKEFVGVPARDCTHAATNSQQYIRQLVRNFSQGQHLSFKSCGVYLDTFSPGLLTFPIDSAITCYRSHSSWSKINAGYVQHPFGGGKWYSQATREYARVIRQAGRDAQAAVNSPVGFWLSCEDFNETVLDVFDFNWHTISSGDLYRFESGNNPDTDRLVAIPLASVVHAGRWMGRALSQEFSTAILYNSAPYNDPNLHAFMGYVLAAEWPYGITFPAFSLFESDTLEFKDFWDETLYLPTGTISRTVRQVRDLWVQIITAETTWICKYLRYGEFMAPAAVDFSVTSVTTGYADSTYASPYYSYDVIYARNQYPRVVHGVWADRATGWIAVIFANWSDTNARWVGTLDVATLGITNSTRSYRADYTGNVDSINGYEFADGALSLEVAAFSICAVIFAVDAETASPKLANIIDKPRRNWDRWSR